MNRKQSKLVFWRKKEWKRIRKWYKRVRFKRWESVYTKFRRLKKWKIKRRGIFKMLNVSLCKRVEYIEPPKRMEAFLVALPNDIVLSTHKMFKKRIYPMKRLWSPYWLLYRKYLGEKKRHSKSYYPVSRYYIKYYKYKYNVNNGLILSSKSPFKLISLSDMKLKNPLNQYSDPQEISFIKYHPYKQRSDLTYPFMWYFKITNISEKILIYKNNKYYKFLRNKTTAKISKKGKYKGRNLFIEDYYKEGYLKEERKYKDSLLDNYKGQSLLTRRGINTRNQRCMTYRDIVVKRDTSILKNRQELLSSRLYGRQGRRLEKDKIGYNLNRMKWVTLNNTLYNNRQYNNPMNEDHVWRDGRRVFSGHYQTEYHIDQTLIKNRNYFNEIYKEVHKYAEPEWVKQERIENIFGTLPLQYWSHLMHHVKDLGERDQLMKNAIKNKGLLDTYASKHWRKKGRAYADYVYSPRSVIREKRLLRYNTYKRWPKVRLGKSPYIWRFHTKYQGLKGKKR